MQVSKDGGNLMSFKTEKELFETALRSSYVQTLLGSYTQSLYLIEPRGLFGIPDLVIAGVDGSGSEHKFLRSFAFEMKLSNWTRALIQAFRYRAFATTSYVVLDQRYVPRALRNLQRFATANVGLLSVDTSANVVVHYQPQPNTPYSVQLEYAFQEMVRRQGICVGASLV
jgi:hypothetical protein